MECEKCGSDNLTVVNKEKTLVTNYYTCEQYEVTVFHIECNDCGNEFEEEM